MATQYRMGHRRRGRSFHVRGVIAVTLLVIGLVVGGVYLLSKEQFHASEAQTSVSQVADPAKDTKTFNEPQFIIELPKDWKLLRSQQTPTIQYDYQSAERFADNRFLTIYVDSLPPKFAVSHMLPVTVQDDGLIIGSMSDRCSNFAGPEITSTTSRSGMEDIAAKWNGVNFICGLSYEVDYIVGTGAAGEAVNHATITGESGAKHVLFFVYNDQNIAPNPTIFFDALRSFKLK
ncbi:MAG: hypothetical protein WBP26_05905 [Candidatus Saccharimonadales bacterium]